MCCDYPRVCAQDRIKYLEGLLGTHEVHNMTYEMVRRIAFLRVWMLCVVSYDTFDSTCAQRLSVANL